MTVVSYGIAHDAWIGHRAKVLSLIRDFHLKSVCEIGAGANPLIPIEQVRELGLDYAILDLSSEELEKAPAGYRRIVADICDPNLALDQGIDLIFSRMLMEHIPDAEAVHRNIYRVLSPGGVAFHFFPTLYGPPFIANRLLPESLADSLLQLVRPRDRHQHAKFPAYYSWCRGPTPRQLARLEEIGYSIVEYTGFFGHSYYRRLPVVQRLHQRLSSWLVRHPRPELTTFAYVILRR